jgi:hypothetical protein
MMAGLLFGAPRVYAAQVGMPAGGTTLTPGIPFTVTPGFSGFPLKITSGGTYIINGSYHGDPMSPAERKDPPLDGAGGLVKAWDGSTAQHGIIVGPGLNVTVILNGVGIYTDDINYAAFIIDGYNGDDNTLASAYQGHPTGSNVIVQLKGNNFLYSNRGCNDGTYVTGLRAGLEVWKGSTVYIEGNGSLIAKCSDTRAYYNSASTGGPPNAPDRIPTTSNVDDQPQGGPYWDGTEGSLSEVNIGTKAYGNSSAAGIGSGNVKGSGGNVVIRGNPAVIAISSAHGAGIGGAWTASKAYHSDILIYGGHVESWGGDHGAGIGGGCSSGDGAIVCLPTADLTVASYRRAYAPLGRMKDVIYFNYPLYSRLALYTDDYRQCNMYLDLSKNQNVRDVIERMGGGLNPSKLELGPTRNDYPATHNQHHPNLADWDVTMGTYPIETGPTKYMMLLNGGFAPNDVNIAFFTDAKTNKNFNYEPVSTKISNNAVNLGSSTPLTYKLTFPTYAGINYNQGNTNVPRIVMVAPVYDPDVTLTPATPPNLYAGYAANHPLNKITLTIGNLGNRRLYNPEITIDGNDYELISSPGTPLQDAVDAALAGLVQYDAGVPYIPTPLEGGNIFSLSVRLKAGKNPGTSYDGYVLFSADDLPEPPDPFQFNIHVIDKVMPPPDLLMEMPTDTVVSGAFRIRAKFKSASNVYPHGVKDLFASHIFVNYGTVTAVTADPATQTSPGFYSDWIISITPSSGLPNRTTISLNVKQGAAEDEIGAHTQTVSKPKLVTFSSSGPYALFNVTEGAVLPSLDTLMVYFDGNSITANKKDSVYINGTGQFTMPGGQANLQSALTLTRLPSTPLSLSAPGQYLLSVVDKNNLKIGSPTTPVAGFPNGDYVLNIPPAIIHNYDGNYLENTMLHFSIQQPEILDGAGAGGEIIPSVLSAPGGTVRIWAYGKHLSAAKGKLIIVIRDPIPGYSAGQEIYIPATNFTDTTAYIDVVLPPNMTSSPTLYGFTIRLLERQPSTDVTPDLTATVNPAGTTIDTTATSLGYREGLHAYPHHQSYEGGAVDLKVVGKNLFRLNAAPNSNLHIRVKKNGVYTATAIPVSTPATLGPVVIPLGQSYTTGKNLSPNADVYAYELWNYVSGVPTAVSETSSGSPYISDSTIVESGTEKLKEALESTHHIVNQRVANTPSTVRKWLTPQLNAIKILRDFELTVAEGDISFTDFDAAIEGSISNPTGMYGSFVFTLTLHTTPAIEVKLNTGEIIPDRFPAVSIEREVTLPEVAGYMTDPPAGDHHVESGRDFTFYLTPVAENTNALVPVVTTNRKIGSDAETIQIKPENDGGHYIVTISEIRESITVYINGVSDSPGAVEDTAEPVNVWGEKGALHIRAIASGQAIIYNIVGRVVATVSLRAGETSRTSLPAGMYIASLNGVSYKALVK